MPEAVQTKKSVYIALAGVIAIALADLAVNGSVIATQVITLPLLAYAAARQVVKMAVGK